MSKVGPQARAHIEDIVKKLKLTLFGVSPNKLADSQAYGELQYSKYGHLGLRYVPAANMAEAIDELFARMQWSAGQRLLEIGPGPKGGVGLIAALNGLHVVMVESDEPFRVDIDQLKQQLGASAATSSIANLSGSVEVNQLRNVKKVIKPLLKLIAAAGGTLRIIPGNFADAAVQDQLVRVGAIDHIVCTDVISPMGDALSNTTVMLTTGDHDKIQSILQGLARFSGAARSLYTGFIIPEENADYRTGILAMYTTLETALRAQGKALFYDRAIAPSSNTILRARLYHLAAPPAAEAVYAESVNARA